LHIAPGTIIAGRYKLEAPIAEGGMGAIWRATHLKLQSGVAIKFMAPSIAASPKARERFEREAKAAAKIQYVHIVHVHDFGIEDDTPFLVMELLRGESFEERLQTKFRLPFGELVPIVTQIAKGLRKAHEAGVVHRDLKPGNIFLVKSEDDDEIVKLVDFGIAKQTGVPVDSSTKTGEFMGSPHYMSPEQVQDSRDIDARSDLWSLGVILFRALTGALPFPGDTVGAIIGKVLTSAIPTPTSYVRGLPDGIDAFFQKALARDRAARFQSAREMASAFAALAGVSMAADEGGRRGSSAPWIRRDHLVAASAPPPVPSGAGTSEPPAETRASEPGPYAHSSQPADTSGQTRASEPGPHARSSQPAGPPAKPSSPNADPFARQGKTIKMAPYKGPAPDPGPPKAAPGAEQAGPMQAISGGRQAIGPGTLTVSPSTRDARQKIGGAEGRSTSEKVRSAPLVMKVAAAGVAAALVALLIVLTVVSSPDANEPASASSAEQARVAGSSAETAAASPAAAGAQEAPATGSIEAQAPATIDASDEGAPPSTAVVRPAVGGWKPVPKEDAGPKAPSDKGLIIIRAVGGTCSKVVVNATTYGSPPLEAIVNPGTSRVFCRTSKGSTKLLEITVVAGQEAELVFQLH
jgi:serine/threonine-protein kinase